MDFLQTIVSDSHNEMLELLKAIIPVLSLFMTVLIFVRQRRKDLDDRKRIAEQNLQAIRLKWFDALIISPQINHLWTFFSDMNLLKGALHGSGFSEENRKDLDEIKKKAFSKILQEFVSVVAAVEPDMGSKMEAEFVKLEDLVTIALFNQGLALHDLAVYKREIEEPIANCRAEILKLLYGFTAQ